MKKIFFVLVLVGLSFACFADKIYPQVSAQEIMTLMQKEGYSVSLDSDNDILWMRDGVKHYVLFKDGAQQNTFITVRCSYGISESDYAAKLEKCNDFNSSYRQGTAYINKKSNSLCIDMILNLLGGVTEERIIDFFDDCKIVIAKWEQEVVNK